MNFDFEAKLVNLLFVKIETFLGPLKQLFLSQLNLDNFRPSIIIEIR